MANLDEEKGWIEKSRQGDHEAFEALIRNYQKMIHSLTYRMTGSMVDAEDLAQEAFIQAYQQLDKFRQESKFSAWLYRIAVNLCLNWRNRDARRQKAHREWSGSVIHETGEIDPDAQWAQRVQDALLKLDPKQRAAVVLTVYDGLNHGEAAQALGCSETTISWRVFAARKKLKKWLMEI